jgi:Fe-S-cluster containining protein
LNFDEIADRYARLLSEVDNWYRRCQSAFPHEIQCVKGCSDCCRALFDITLLDAWFLRVGFKRLTKELRSQVALKAGERLQGLRTIWPELSPPYLLNHRPEDQWQELMPEEDETPCVLLGEDGRCLVYEHRPMTCRLHGLPLIDPDGTVMHDEWCTMNFPGIDPLQLTELRADFTRMFREEVAQFRGFERLLLNKGFMELDTFIPLALLVDSDSFDWKQWLKTHR